MTRNNARPGGAVDRFSTMESFVRVVRAGSFTIAANQLGLSRALVSRHVSELEHRLGVRLLTRSTRSLSLTEEGRSYLAFCEQLLRDLESKERSVAGARTETVGTLKLTAPKSFGVLHVADATVAFAQAQPKVRISLLLEDVSLRMGEFGEKGLDLALRITSARNVSFVAEEIVPLDWVACASPGYLARAGRPRTPADLAQHACIVHVNVLPSDHVWRFEGPRGPQSIKVKGAFMSNSALALRKAALAHLGVALVPRYVVADDLGSGRLVAVMPRYRAVARPLLAVYPRAASVPQKVRVFVDFLKEWFAARNVNRSARAAS
jgi:DNA-binding transcriptional LysR family regulator